MEEFFAVLAPFEVLFLAYAIIYGVPFGFANTLRRFGTLFTGKVIRQSDLGKLCDGVFWFTLLVLFVLNVK